MDDLMIVSSLDQNLPSKEELFDRIDAVVQTSIEQKNPYIALDACRQLRVAAKLSGLGLAKFFYLLEENWPIFETDESFMDVAYEYVGVHRHTVDRYLSVWSMFDTNQIPETLEETMRQRNIKDLTHIAKALEQGLEIDEDTWEKLAYAPDYNTLMKTLREDVRHKPPRKGSLQIMMNDIGTMWVWSDGERFDLGSLRLLDNTEAVQKAISRIVSNAGVIRK